MKEEWYPIPTEGITRCECGCKYWDKTTEHKYKCTSCGETYKFEVIRQEYRWAVISDDTPTYVAFETKKEAIEWSNQFCPMGKDGERDCNVTIVPETHKLIEILGMTERAK